MRDNEEKIKLAVEAELRQIQDAKNSLNQFCHAKEQGGANDAVINSVRKELDLLHHPINDDESIRGNLERLSYRLQEASKFFAEASEITTKLARNT